MNTREMWWQQGVTRAVMTDHVAILSHVNCALKRGYSNCQPYHAHAIVLHPDGTTQWLCHGEKVSTTLAGWWTVEADVLAILCEPIHVEPLKRPPSYAAASGTFLLAGHRFCIRCELMLDRMNRAMKRQNYGQ